MKCPRLVIIMILFAHSLFAQDQYMPEPEDSTKYNLVKIHKNFRFESMPNLIFNGDDFNYFIQRQNFFGSGFGLSYARNLKNGDQFEIGLAELMISNSTNSTTWIERDSLIYGRINEIEYKRRDFIIELNYALCLGEGLDKNWRFFAGASLLPFLQSFELEPASDGFPVSLNIVGVTLGVYPALQFEIFDNGWLDIRFPFQLIRIAGVAGENQDDFLNLFEEQQRQTDFELLPPIYELRVGLGFAF